MYLEFDSNTLKALGLNRHQRFIVHLKFTIKRTGEVPSRTEVVGHELGKEDLHASAASFRSIYLSVWPREGHHRVSVLLDHVEVATLFFFHVVLYAPIIHFHIPPQRSPNTGIVFLFAIMSQVLLLWSSQCHFELNKHF